MTISIKPIKPKRISDQVFEQIRELIFRGTLKPGDKLMTEQQLALAMNVSRTTVRNAIQRLTTMGMIIQKQGQGTFVKPIDTSMENPLAKVMEAHQAQNFPSLIKMNQKAAKKINFSSFLDILNFKTGLLKCR